MVLNTLTKIVMNTKTKIRQRRLRHEYSDFNKQEHSSQLASLDDYLLAGNAIALKYFENNTHTLKKLVDYHGFRPNSSAYSKYTYAAFLSLTDKHNKSELQNDVRWSEGMFVSIKTNGYHAFLEKKVGDKWEAFETIPEMRNTPMVYSTWYTFQITPNKINAQSKRALGLISASFYRAFSS